MSVATTAPVAPCGPLLPLPRLFLPLPLPLTLLLLLRLLLGGHASSCFPSGPCAHCHARSRSPSRARSCCRFHPCSRSCSHSDFYSGGHASSCFPSGPCSRCRDCPYYPLSRPFLLSFPSLLLFLFPLRLLLRWPRLFPVSPPAPAPVAATVPITPLAPVPVVVSIPAPVPVPTPTSTPVATPLPVSPPAPAPVAATVPLAPPAPIDTPVPVAKPVPTPSAPTANKFPCPICSHANIEDAHFCNSCGARIAGRHEEVSAPPLPRRYRRQRRCQRRYRFPPRLTKRIYQSR